MRIPTIARGLLGCISAAAILGGCDGKEVSVTLHFTRDFNFAIDTDVGEHYFAQALRNVLLGGLNIPSDADVQSVHLESIQLIAQPADANTASEVGVLVEYSKQSETPQAFTSTILVPLVALYSAPLDNLTQSVVNAMRSDVEAMLLGSPGAPDFVTLEIDVRSSIPSDARVRMNATVKVNFTVVYTICKDLSVAGIGAGGADCVVGGL
jgi:hypothetical protein